MYPVLAEQEIQVIQMQQRQRLIAAERYHRLQPDPSGRRQSGLFAAAWRGMVRGQGWARTAATSWFGLRAARAIGAGAGKNVG